MLTDNTQPRARLAQRTVASVLVPFLASLISGCAGLHSGLILDHLPSEWTLAYPNEPARDEAEPDSSAYLASSRVPWFVNLHSFAERHRVDDRARELRQLRQEIYESWKQAIAPDLGLERTDRDRDFVGIALAGGGSRAAVFSLAVMYELEERGLLRQADVISGISGGAIAAALYTATCDRGDTACPRRAELGEPLIWDPADRDQVFRLLEHDFLADTFLRVYLDPRGNVSTANTFYDRSDALADTLDYVLFGGSYDDAPNGLEFRDLNPRRPNLILNAMNQSVRDDYQYLPLDLAGVNFPITMETFDFLGSDLHRLPLAYGVAGSNAIPGVFHPVTLRNYKADRSSPASADEVFAHVVDGGVFDRTGTCALLDILKTFDHRDSQEELPMGCGGQLEDYQPAVGRLNDSPPERATVIVIDGGSATEGEDQTESDARSTIDRLFNLNAFSAFNFQQDLLTKSLNDRLDRFMKARHRPESGRAYSVVRFALSSLIGGISHRNLSCEVFDDHFDDKRREFYRNGARPLSLKDAMKESNEKINGKHVETAYGEEDPPDLPDDVLGRIHLWCDIQKSTELALSISRQSSTDLRVAAERVVDDELKRICREDQTTVRAKLGPGYRACESVEP